MLSLSIPVVFQSSSYNIEFVFALTIFKKSLQSFFETWVKTDICQSSDHMSKLWLFPVELCQSNDHMSKLGLYESVKAVIVCQSSECILK